MKTPPLTLRVLAAVAIWGVFGFGLAGDDLRNIKHGEPVPALKLPLVDGSAVDSETMKSSVLVIVCVAADQPASDLAAEESAQVASALGNESVQVIHVTADTEQKGYFEKFRKEHKLSTRLAMDADRAYLSKLGVIAFPTTVVVNKQQRLSHVILLHETGYKERLDAYVRHALGTISDKQLEELLAVNPAPDRASQRAAAAHRAMARMMLEKGQIDGAKAELIKGLALDGQSTDILLDLAELHLAARTLDEADAMLERVLKAHPDDRRARRLKGESLYRRGKPDEARALLQQVLTPGPGLELAHYYLGRIAERKGEKDRAIEHYREALKIFAHDPDPAPAEAKAPK